MKRISRRRPRERRGETAPQRPRRDPDGRDDPPSGQRAALQGTAQRYAIPEKVTFVEALPHTSVGKIGKRSLRVAYEQ